MAKQLDNFMKLLPYDFRKIIKEISLSYYDELKIVKNHLKTLYGNIGDWEHILKKYPQSKEYQKTCRYANSCEEVPELSTDDVLKMLNEDEKYLSSINRLKSLAAKEEDCGNTLQEQARLLGILPTSDKDALFPHFLLLDEIRQSNCGALLMRAKGNEDILRVCVIILRKFFEDGIIRSSPQCDETMMQQRGKYYYRGENAFYPQSNASAYRNNTGEISEDLIEVIYLLRLYECFETFDELNAINGWWKSDADYLALAQHYGFHTKMLDITTSGKTALFFACCVLENNSWRPLKEEEIRDFNSRKNISDQACK